MDRKSLILFACLLSFISWENHWLPRMIPVVEAASLTADRPLYFYRSQSSSFPSGQSPFKELEKNLLRFEGSSQFMIQSQNKYLWVPFDTLLRSIQMSSRAHPRTEITLYSEPRQDSRPLRHLINKDLLNILALQQEWAYVQSNAETRGWVLLDQLKDDENDTGFVIPLIDTFLKKNPDALSEALIRIPPGSRLTPIKFDKEWVKVSHAGKIGYVDLGHCVLRHDFATEVWHNQQWIPVQYRQGDQMKTLSGQWIPLDQISRMKTQSNKGIIAKDHLKYNLYLRSQVQIHRQETKIWSMSFLKGHGEVWWPRKTEILEMKEQGK